VTKTLQTERRKVLVTGAGGFIGSHLAVELAQRGECVVAQDIDLKRVRHLETAGRFELVEGDIADPALQRQALRGVRTVFHLAAAHLSVAAGDDEFWRVNVRGLESLTQAATEAGISRFVHCSSVGVYGHVASPPADESTPCHPDLVYEESKLAGEKVILDAVRERDFPAVILRPAWVYGPGCGRTEKLFRTIRKGRFIVGGGGVNLRHCVYIRDMLEAFLLAESRDAALGQVIIVGDAGAVKVRDLIDEMARIVDARRPPSVPLFVLRVAGTAAELASKPLGMEPAISRRTLKFFTANSSFDISRARELLGFEPRYDLASGLAETYLLLSGEEPWRLAFKQAAEV